MLFPIIYVCTPIYKLYKKHEEAKRYSDKQIRSTIQYLIDYWANDEDEFYIIFNNYNPLNEESSSVKTPFDMQSDMSWGWNGENKKIKKKASHIYYYQKEQYLKILEELCLEICENPMTEEEKKQHFKYYFNRIKDIETYKIK
jgi:hypothetical protein